MMEIDAQRGDPFSPHFRDLSSTATPDQHQVHCLTLTAPNRSSPGHALPPAWPSHWFEELWAEVAPLLPPPRPKKKPGRPRIPDRAALTGVIFVLKTGLPWEYLPQEMGCGSGMTCWRRLRDWQAAGVWHRLHVVLLNRLGQADRIDWSRASADGARLPAKKGGAQTGPNPTNRGKPGSHRHVLTDRGGAPLVELTTAANVNEGTLLEALVDAFPPIHRPAGQPGRPRQRPHKLHADKANDSRRCRAVLRRRHIIPRIARRRIDSSECLGRYRWVVGRTIAWLPRNRRLLIRYERRPELHQAFLDLGCALICWHLLPHGTEHF